MQTNEPSPEVSIEMLSTYKKAIVQFLEQRVDHKEPANLYTPVQYILELGGKRIRPILTLMSADLLGADFKQALPAAAAVELFHNFTLVHDDIMDKAPLRRGKETVHTKWDLNTAILSGDALLILAYRFFEAYEGVVFKDLHLLLNQTAIEVMEGQQLDVDFESRQDVKEIEYLKMIELKTSVLLGAALKMGAIIAKVNTHTADGIYEFGRNLGIAFQLQDDCLDTYGDPEKFGKQVGGDILEKKKTYLYISCLNAIHDPQDKEAFQKLYASEGEAADKVTQVKAYFEKYNVESKIKEAIESYTAKSFAVLQALAVEDQCKEVFRMFGEQLMTRSI